MGGAIRRGLVAQPEHVLTSGEWFVCVPEESTNLITNPSGEVDTTGWSAVGTGVSVTRDTSKSYYGAACLKMTISAATGSGEYIQTANMPVTAGTTYTASFRFQKFLGNNQTGDIGIFWYTSGAVFISQVSLSLPRGSIMNNWVYQSYTAVAPATAAFASVYFSTADVIGGSFELWLDGVQLEAKPYATTYIDGTQDDCVWLGVAHGSASYRPSTTRKGGRLQPMSNYKFKIASVIGAGAAALSTLATPYAQTGGGYYQGSVAPPRTIALTGAFECDSAIDLARRRSELFAAVNPLATPNGQPARLVYVPQSCGSNIAEGIVIDGVYGGGLEGNLTNDFGQERAALTFTTYLPFAAVGSGVGNRAVTGGVNQAYSYPTVYNLIARNKLTGAWNTLSGGANQAYLDYAIGTDGLPVFIGTFTNIGGVAANYVARWTGSTFQALSTGPASASGFQRIAIGPDNAVYYSASTSLTNCRLYKWNGSAWSTLADFAHGSDAGIRALAFGPDGKLYVGGQFTTAGGVAAVNIASYDGSTWAALSSGMNGEVYDIRAGKSGEVYAAGDFTTAGGTAAPYVAKWSGSAWSTLGGGMDGIVVSIYVDKTGLLYAGGNFATAGGVTAYDIAVWNGAGWSPLGSGIQTTSNRVRVFEDNSPGVIVVGFFSPISDLSIANAARWTGSTWTAAPVYVNPIAGNILTIYAQSGIYEFFGGAFTDITVPSVTSVTVTTQTNNVQLVMTGPGRVVSLKNFTTGDEILFNLTIQAGEVVTLTVGDSFSLKSTWRGDISGAVVAGSTVSKFRLLPGANNVSLFMTGTTGASAAALTYREMYSSLDNLQ